MESLLLNYDLTTDKRHFKYSICYIANENIPIEHGVKTTVGVHSGD